MDRYDLRARLVLMFAREEGTHLKAPHIGPELVLLGLLREGGDVAAVCEAYGVLEHDVRTRIQAHYEDAPPGPAFPPISPSARAVMREASRFAKQHNDPEISTRHLLLGIIDTPNTAAQHILQELGVDIPRLAAEFAPEVTPGTPELTGPLANYATDLTALAEGGKLDPVIGRDAEIARMIQILVRRTKNNPVLLGEPGVGKTAVVEGLAQLIASGNAPEALAGVRLLSLDLSQIVAGTKYRGEFEERINEIVSELTGERVVAFIDEIHTLVGAGSAEGTLDAANILKPALSRGEIQLIGATTHREYEQYIEKDAALERRFQPVLIDEPSAEETLHVLQGIRERYEAHHHVVIPNEVLVHCVKLAERALPTRRFPDKAIDLLDEAAARTSILRGSGEHVTHADVEGVLQSWSGLYSEDEQRRRVANLYNQLASRVFGQHSAVKAVVQALKRRQVGLAPRNEVAAALYFQGPAGAGKRHLATVLTEELRGSADALITVSGADYADDTAVHRLLGMPRGYAGADHGGVLTNAVKRKPFSVILFTNVELAHPDVHTLLSNILQRGQAGEQQLVDFRRTMLIVSEHVPERAGVSFQPAAPGRASRSALPSTLLDLFDQQATFLPLSEAAVTELIEHELTGLAATLQASGWRIAMAPTVATKMLGLIPANASARVVQHAIQDHIIDPLSEALMLRDQEVPLVVHFNNQLVVSEREVHA